MQPFLSRSRGYSLIELLVVLVIVGVLSLVAVFYYMDRNGPAVKGSLQDLHAALTEARDMARATGQTVTVTVTGVGRSAAFTYSATSGQNGSFHLAGDTSVAAYCMVDDGSSGATTSAITSLKGALGGVTFTSSSGAGTIWNNSNNLFGSSGNTVTFNSLGVPSMEFFVSIVGQSNGTSTVSGPVGIILVSSSGNIYRYYRASSSATWARL